MPRHQENIASLRRSAGFKPGREVSLGDVDRRRSELWSISIGIVLVFVAAIALFTVGQDLLPESLQFESLNSWIVAVLMSGLVMALMIYVFEKEIVLRRLTRLLTEERVRTTALTTHLHEVAELSEVTKALNATLEVDALLRLILDTVLRVIGGDEASVMLLDEAGTHLEVVNYRGLGPDAIKGARVPLGQGISGVVAERQTPMLLQGNNLEPVVRDAGHPERNISSAMSAPLVRRGELLGVLNLTETKGDRIFAQADLDALGFFADHAAIAISNARAFEAERETVARLEELDRMKNDFVATVSHELKSPLTAIIGSAQTLSRKGSRMTPEQRTQFIDAIDRQGVRLLRLIQDVLTTSQVESGGFRLRREPIDFGSLVADIVTDLSHSDLIGARRLALDVRPNNIRGWADSMAVQQMLTNLIENAFKYSDDAKEIVVTVQARPSEILLSVADQGPGIDDEQLATIFERFRQIECADTRSAGGVGLGLFIVKSLVEAHGGRIEVISAPNEGSTFTIYLPQRASDMDAVAPEVRYVTGASR